MPKKVVNVCLFKIFNNSLVRCSRKTMKATEYMFTSNNLKNIYFLGYIHRIDTFTYLKKCLREVDK